MLVKAGYFGAGLAVRLGLVKLVDQTNLACWIRNLVGSQKHYIVMIYLFCRMVPLEQPWFAKQDYITPPTVLDSAKPQALAHFSSAKPILSLDWVLIIYRTVHSDIEQY